MRRNRKRVFRDLFMIPNVSIIQTLIIGKQQYLIVINLSFVRRNI